MWVLESCMGVGRVELEFVIRVRLYVDMYFFLGVDVWWDLVVFFVFWVYGFWRW